jgi:2-polyprenyl-6-methoxyphenol hydroxylase-like FAD-dependent oxidoreductase
MSDVVVLGAGLAGLWAAAAAADAGSRVLILERDNPEDHLGLRPGVPQGSQPHVFLHRGLRAGGELLPGLRADLLAAGGVRIDTGLLPWRGEHGWLPPQPSYDVVSLTRPLLEHVVRERVLRLPSVDIRWGVHVRGLARDGGDWRVRTTAGPEISAAVVIDATGRSSRLRHWLADLGVSTPEPWTVDAHVGYATQVVAGGPDPQDLPGVVLQATPDSSVGGLALPVEGRRWLVTAVGFGERRPPRDPDGFAAFLADLADPAVSTILCSGEQVGEVAVHRQTANRRHRYAHAPGWPEGLLAVGDALCCFNPVYGQGVTVSATEALLLRSALRSRTDAGATRRVLRAFDRLVDFPWAVAIGQDLRMPSSSGRQTLSQAAVSAWAWVVGREAAHGDHRAQAVLLGTYHLESPPLALLHPALVASVARGCLRRGRAPAPRPPVLEALTA